MASAEFTINGATNPGLHVVAYNSFVQLALVSTHGISTCSFAIVGVSKSDQAYPNVTLSGTPHGTSASFQMPSDPGDGIGRSFLIKATAITVEGRQITSTGLVGAANALGGLPIASGEKLERDGTHGWIDAVNLAPIAAAPAFTALGDTPGAYAGAAGMVPRVNSAETGLEFVLPSINPKWFGADGTGVTLSTSQVLSAATMADTLGVPLDLDYGTYLVGDISFPMSLEFTGNGKLIGEATVGTRPARADLTGAANSAARLALFDAHYPTSITFTGSGPLVGAVELERCVLKSGGTVFVRGTLTLTDCATTSSLEAELGGTIVCPGLLSADTGGSAWRTDGGGHINAAGAISVSCFRGAQTLNGGSINLSGGEIWNTSSHGAFCLYGGSILLTGGTVDGSGGNGLLINYGGTMDISNGYVRNCSGGIIAESSGTVYAENATLSGNTTSALSTSFEAFIQARGATVDGNPGVAVEAFGGTVHLENATVTANNGTSPSVTSIIRARGDARIYLNEQPGSGGLSGLTNANLTPDWGTIGNGAAYIGDSAYNDNVVIDMTNGRIGLGLAPSSDEVLRIARTGSDIARNYMSGESEVSEQMDRYSNDSAGPVMYARKGRGTSASPLSTSNGDFAFQISAFARDGAATNREIVRETFRVGSVPGSNDIAGFWAMLVRPSGIGAALVQALRVDSTGIQVTGEATDSSGTLQAIPTATTAQLEDITDTINTANKFTGKFVNNTTAGTLVRSSGTAAGSSWLSLTGASAHVPV